MDMKKTRGHEKKFHVHAHVLEKIAITVANARFFCQEDVRT